MASDDVSDPANINVLMLCRMSASEMRCSGERSAAALDLTEGDECYGKKEVTGDQHTQKAEKILALISLPLRFGFGYLPLLLLYEVSSDTPNDLLTTSHGMSRLVRLYARQPACLCILY